MEDKIMIQVGSKNTGKTNYCKLYLKEKSPKRALILDIQNEYNDIKKLDNLQLEHFILDTKHTGIYRYTFEGNLAENKMQFASILTNYRQGTMIIENPCILFGHIPQELLGLMCIHRTKNVNIIVNFLSLKRALNPKILQNANFYHLYKNIEPISKFKSILGNCYDLFLDAETYINKNKSIIIDIANDKFYEYDAVLN